MAPSEQKSALEVTFLGGAQTVTGSRIRLDYKGHRYMVDCGLFQGPREIRERNWASFDGASDIEAVVLTHAHIDHSGFLPRLVRDGFKGPIYCSEATAALCRIMLLDSAHLQEEDAYYANKTRHSRHEPALPLYDTADAERTLRLFYPIDLESSFELTEGLGFELVRSGHILGSTYIRMDYGDGNGSRVITFSGDLGNGRSHVLRAPAKLQTTDYLILESTYGDRLQPRTDAQEELGAIVRKVIGRGGILVIPAFTVGRTQEIVYLLRELESQNKIPKVPVYVDSPMALNATELYLKFPLELKTVERDGHLETPFSSEDFRPVQSANESMMLVMDTDPKIVISAAGMLTGGRVMHHLKARLPDPKSGVLFVGYQAEGTKGRLLRHGLNSIRIHHEKIMVEAEIFSIDSLSAHADSDDLLEWVKNTDVKPQKIFLNHGEDAALGALRYRLVHELGLDAEVALLDQSYALR